MNHALWQNTKNLRAAALLLLFYLAATQLAHTLLYTIVAYIVSAAEKTGTDFGNTVNEIAGQYHFFTFSMGALLLTLTRWQADRALYLHDPFWNEPQKPLWQLDHLTKAELLRGLSSGVAAACVYLFLFTISGQGSYLGIYITSTFGTPVFPLFFLDLLSISLLVFCEEYIFRHKILKLLSADLSPGVAVLITSLLYIGVKHLQFDLSTLDILNLGCMNLALGYFYLKSTKAHRGLGFLFILLLLLHSMAGLPLWGNESPSFFLFKSTPTSSSFLFGGESGPFAGIALTSLFFFFAFGSSFSWKREMEAKRQAKRGLP